jgi:hypothetical protein
MRDSQLLLIPGHSEEGSARTAARSPRHRLDERTRQVGMEGIAAARAILRATRERGAELDTAVAA